MTARYVLTEHAQQDLDDIGESIAGASGLALAEQVVNEFRRAFQLLAENPGVGHSCEGVTDDPQLRFWNLYSYLIVFVPTASPLAVVSILHGARDPESMAQSIEDARSPEE